MKPDRAIWGVCYKDFGENLPRYNGTALYWGGSRISYLVGNSTKGKCLAKDVFVYKWAEPALLYMLSPVCRGCWYPSTGYMQSPWSVYLFTASAQYSPELNGFIGPPRSVYKENGRGQIDPPRAHDCPRIGSSHYHHDNLWQTPSNISNYNSQDLLLRPMAPFTNMV